MLENSKYVYCPVCAMVISLFSSFLAYSSHVLHVYVCVQVGAGEVIGRSMETNCHILPYENKLSYSLNHMCNEAVVLNNTTKYRSN